MGAASKNELFIVTFGKWNNKRTWKKGQFSSPASKQLCCWAPKFVVFLPAELLARLVKFPLWGVDNQRHRQWARQTSAVCLGRHLQNNQLRQKQKKAPSPALIVNKGFRHNWFSFHSASNLLLLRWCLGLMGLIWRSCLKRFCNKQPRGGGGGGCRTGSCSRGST